MEREKDMTYNQKIDELIDSWKDEMYGTLKGWVAIKSVRGEAQDGAPFGPEPRRALDLALSDAEGMGFAVRNVAGYAGDVTLNEGGEAVMGILAHLDIVPAGDGWTHDPLDCYMKDGRVYGRGTQDDKGPAVAALYAMRAVREAGVPLRDTVRLILGTDEESGSGCLRHYKAKMPTPDYGFSPDADFPVLNGEKGIMSFKIAAKLKRDTVKGLALRKLSGGTAVNMVPAAARAVVNDQDPAVYDRIREMAENYEMTTGHALGLHKMGKSLEITAKGKASHGSMPEQGVNAVSVLIGFLGQLNFVNEDLCRFFDFYNDCIGMTTDGSKIGIAMADEESGALTLNPGVLEYDGQAVSVKCDVRYPVTKTSDEVYSGMMPYIDKYGLGVLNGEDREPVYLDPESPMIKAFMDCYRDATGDTEHGPIVIGGGTYARTCDNVVAFGAMFPGDPQLEHQPNERMPLDRFVKIMRIYAEAIYRITKPGFHF